MAAGKPRKMISAEAVIGLRDHLIKLGTQPPPTPVRTEYSKQAVVTELLAEIQALQRRGYTLEHIADEATKSTGSTFTSQSLNTFIKRSKVDVQASPPKQKKLQAVVPSKSKQSAADPLAGGAPAGKTGTASKPSQSTAVPLAAGTFNPPDDKV